MLFVGFVMIIGLWIVGLFVVFVIGFVVGLCEFVFYFGIFVVVVLLVILVFSESMMIGVWIIVVFVVV